MASRAGAAQATTRGVTLAALLAVLGRPTWWVLALAGFLIRGGILLFVLAIVTVPSPLVLSNLVAPYVTPLVFGQVEAGTIALVAALIGSAIVWLLAGTWIAAATEVVLVGEARAAAAEDGLPVAPARPAGSLLVTRAAAAHLVALAPLGVALGLGSIGIVDVLYRELVNPSDASPIVLRVILGARGQVAAILVCWVLGELVGGGAVRRIVLGGEPVLGAVGRAAASLVRRPGGALLAPLLTAAVLAVDLLAVLLVVAIVWTEMRDRLVRPLDDPLATILAVLTFAAGWCLALLVTGLIAAWRSAAMTVEDERRRARGESSGAGGTPAEG